MGKETGISWCDHTFNPWRGCTKVSEGCKHCYAEQMSYRNPAVLGEWGPNGKRAIAAESYWMQPHTWDNAARRDGVRRRVFVASLADVFEDNEQVAEARKRLWATIEACTSLDWLLLTKRPENIARMLPEGWQRNPRPHVWLGTSVENQEQALLRLPYLLSAPARIHFVSCEPLLGPVDIVSWPYIDWVICGGESGPKARPMRPNWARSLHDQCKEKDIAFFFKQWGEYVQIDGHMERIGKKAAGDLLDGCEHKAFPVLEGK